MLRLLRLQLINCSGRCLPCLWCRIEENIIEKRTKKKKKKRREKEREREKKKVVYLFQSAAY